MQLNEIAGNAEDQNRGAWLMLADPWSGKQTGIELLLAGPDSATQAEAALTLADELAELMELDGRISAANRDKARLRNLARCVRDWRVQEDGKPVPFTFENVCRLLRAAKWVQIQVDAFAADRRNFPSPGKGGE